MATQRRNTPQMVVVTMPPPAKNVHATVMAVTAARAVTVVNAMTVVTRVSNALICRVTAKPPWTGLRLSIQSQMRLKPAYNNRRQLLFL
jgi:hypothetical protein